jgi:hypothetical protein
MPEQRALARAVEAELGSLTSAATQRMSTELPWFDALPADMRALVGSVAHAGIQTFARWLSTPTGVASIAEGVFGVAPRALARAITLQQTVDLVRVTVAVVEERASELVTDDTAAELRDAVLRFAREVAFAVAQVYAAAAEERGAWHTRLRTVLIDALLRDDPPDVVETHAAALGWQARPEVVAVVGPGPASDPERFLDDVERHCRSLGLEGIAATHGGWVIVIAGGGSLASSVKDVAAGFPRGPVVVGDIASSVPSAGASARSALAGARAAAGWPDAPVPVMAAELLVERALTGDPLARQTLVQDVYQPLRDSSGSLLETVSAYLDLGGSVEGTARALFLHPNTVRHRLKRVADVTSHVPSQPRDAFTLRAALSLGRLGE